MGRYFVFKCDMDLVKYEEICGLGTHVHSGMKKWYEKWYEVYCEKGMKKYEPIRLIFLSPNYCTIIAQPLFTIYLIPTVQIPYMRLFMV
jgi:hypothetical protein